MKPTIKLINRLSLYLFLILFQTSSWADDIRDFEIDGMSVGDSLLDYYSKSKIDSPKKTLYPSSDKFYGISFYTSESETFEAYTFSLKKNDNKYIIYDIGGIREFPNDLENCKKLKKNVVESFRPNADGFEYVEYDHIYKTLGSGKSIAYISSYKSASGSVRIYCTNWTDLDTKEMGYIDELSVDLSSKEFLNFLDYEAY